MFLSINYVLLGLTSDCSTMQILVRAFYGQTLHESWRSHDHPFTSCGLLLTWAYLWKDQWPRSSASNCRCDLQMLCWGHTKLKFSTGFHL